MPGPLLALLLLAPLTTVDVDEELFAGFHDAVSRLPSAEAPVGIWAVAGGVRGFRCEETAPVADEPPAHPPPASSTGGLPTRFVYVFAREGLVVQASDAPLYRRPDLQLGAWQREGDGYMLNGVGDMIHVVHANRIDVGRSEQRITLRRCRPSVRQPAPSARRALRFVSRPPDAEVAINGRARCRTPCDLDLPHGSYRVGMRLDGFIDEELSVDVSATTLPVMVQLAPSGLLVTVDCEGALAPRDPRAAGPRPSRCFGAFAGDHQEGSAPRCGDPAVRIFIDGEPGHCGVNLARRRPASVRVEVPGFEPWKGEAAPNQNDLAWVKPQLVAERAWLRVTSPATATVTVDGADEGPTPWERRVRIGSRRVRLSSPDGEAHAVVEVLPGSGADLELTPKPLGGLVKIVSGRTHWCALSSTGAVRCGGGDRHGQASPPGGRFIDVSARYDQSCGVRDDGAVLCWGSAGNHRGGAPALSPEGRYQKVFASRTASLALDEEGRLGRFAPPGMAARVTPEPDERFVTMDVDFMRACLVRTDHVVKCFQNLAGPTVLPAKLRSISVAGGHDACGIDVEGKLWCQGPLARALPVGEPAIHVDLHDDFAGRSACVVLVDRSVRCVGGSVRAPIAAVPADASLDQVAIVGRDVCGLHAGRLVCFEAEPR